MDGWQIVALLLGSSVVAAVVSGVVALIGHAIAGSNQKKALDQQRLTDNTRLLMDLNATAHGRPTDGRDGSGTAEQFAALHMIFVVGATYSPLEPAAHALLDGIAIQDSFSASGLQTRAKELRRDLRPAP